MNRDKVSLWKGWALERAVEGMPSLRDANPSSQEKGTFSAMCVLIDTEMGILKTSSSILSTVTIETKEFL
jgi:hypothetical protein